MEKSKRNTEAQRKERLGEINYNKYGSKMTIIDYISSDNISVKFEDGYITNTCYSSFKKGSVSNPYDKTVCSIGYLGEGIYITFKNGKHTREYHDWLHMIQRCYLDKNLLARPTYKDCSVCEEWHNFQNFAKWHKENFYQVDGQSMCLDKDILIKGNKIYSPTTCIFTPKRISNIFEIKTENVTGIRGVHFDKRYNTYSASCGIGDNKQTKHIGTYKTKEEAFIAYKIFKEAFIKQVADEYKDKIPKALYDAMYRYIVEITDK
jgi:hypothetical protein